MYIYDRWGESILIQENFPANDPAYGWDGKFRNQLLNEGVFVYYFVVEFNDGRTKEYKGDVNLVR
jgi:gliding motility-associated-like protein